MSGADGLREGLNVQDEGISIQEFRFPGLGFHV